MTRWEPTKKGSAKGQEIDSTPMLFLDRPLRTDFQSGKRRLGDPEAARVFKMRPPRIPRLIEISTASPTLLTQSAEPAEVNQEQKIEVSTKADGLYLPTKPNPILIEESDPSDVLVELTQDAQAGADELWVAPTGSADGEIPVAEDIFGADDVILIEQEGIRETVEIEDVSENRIILKQPLLFSVGLAFQIDLDTGDVSIYLRKEFEHSGTSLSQNVSASSQRAGINWLIVDEGNKQTYVVN